MEEKRIIKLCDKHGIENESVENVEVGYKYALRFPIIITSDGVEKSRTTEVEIKAMLTRADQKVLSKIKDDDEQLDFILDKMTNLGKVGIDNLTNIDLTNLVELINGFLPEKTVKNITKS